MTKIDITKKIVSAIVGIGTGKIVHDIVKNNVDVENIYNKVAVTSASLVIGSVAADVTSLYTNNMIDNAASWWEKNVTNR